MTKGVTFLEITQTKRNYRIGQTIPKDFPDILSSYFHSTWIAVGTMNQVPGEGSSTDTAQ